jgi:hypothetical protein
MTHYNSEVLPQMAHYCSEVLPQMTYYSSEVLPQMTHYGFHRTSKVKIKFKLSREAKMTAD